MSLLITLHSHTKHASWGARYNMLATVQLCNVFPDIGAPDAGMTLDTHVVAQCQHHLLYLSGQLPRGREHKGLCFPQLDVDFLEDSDRKRSRFSRPRLSSVYHQEQKDG